MKYYYGDFLWDDLFSDRKGKWLNKIISYGPQKTDPKWDVLDVGFGFFSVILGELGHNVSNISFTEGLLDKARIYADLLGIRVNYQKMNGHVLSFPNDSFDLIISRDFTWTFHDPVKIYNEWKRVLRPGGKVLIFDANYGLFCFNDEIAEKKLQSEDAYRKNYGKLPAGAICEERVKQMFFSNKLRPAWDISIFSRLGMNISTEIGLSDELCSEHSRLLNGAAPMFLIAAEKQCTDIIKKNEKIVYFPEGYCKITTIRWD